MNEVHPGIYQLKLPLPGADKVANYVNAYAVRGDGKYLLVDAGLNSTGAFDMLEKLMAKFGASPSDISHIVVTHLHPDHYGLVGKVKKASGARFYMHELDEALVEGRYARMEDLLVRMADWLRVNGVPDNDLPVLQTASVNLARFIDHVHPDVALKGGETIDAGDFSFKVLWTPGHSPGHVALYERAKKLLFTGDLIMPNITPNIGLQPNVEGNPLGEYMASLDRVKDLDVDLILPGHQDPFTGLKERVEELVEHHKQRKEEVLGAIRSGASTGYEVAQGISWQTDLGGGWQDLSRWHRRLAVLETLSHLKAMTIDGSLDEIHNNCFIRYKIRIERR